MKVNDRLFAGGRADTLYGTFMPGIREWVGGAWHPIPGCPLDETGTYYCGTYWHDQYWFAGSFISGGARSVITFDGVDQWTPNWGPGGGWINGIAGFGDSLYVGGYYPPGSDTESPFIQLWDGAAWQPFFPDVLQFHSQIFDLEVYDGALYVSGMFFFNSDPSTYYSILRYDGHTLCAIGGVNTAGYNGPIAFFQGDLYMSLAAAFPELDHQFIGKLALDGLVPDHCVEVMTGVAEHDQVSSDIRVVPNPTAGPVQIILPEGEGELFVFDVSGREVLEAAVVKKHTSLDLGVLAPGSFVLVFIGLRTFGTTHLIKD
jgi:hypothetical protein